MFSEAKKLPFFESRGKGMKFHSPCAHCSNILFFIFLFIFFFNKLTPVGTAFQTVYTNFFKLQGQFLQLAPTASHCKSLPSQQPFFFFFFFPVGGKNINNKNVIGNCCHLQKKWRNEAQTFLSGITGTPFLRTELCVWGCTAWAVKS